MAINESKWTTSRGARAGGAGALSVALILLLQGCDDLAGRWVSYTLTTTLASPVSVRGSEPFASAGTFELNDLTRVVDSIPDDAEITHVVITWLDADITALPTTNAESLTLAAFVQDLTGARATITKEKTIGNWLTGVKTVVGLIPDAAKREALNDLRNRINAFLSSGEDIQLRLGVQGTPTGGRVDADLNVVLGLTITYEVCESVDAPLLLAIALAECVVNE